MLVCSQSHACSCTSQSYISHTSQAYISLNCMFLTPQSTLLSASHSLLPPGVGDEVQACDTYDWSGCGSEARMAHWAATEHHYRGRWPVTRYAHDLTPLCPVTHYHVAFNRQLAPVAQVASVHIFSVTAMCKNCCLSGGCRVSRFLPDMQRIMHHNC